MKVKVVIFALVLIAIVICLPNRNQAYMGPPYFDRFNRVDEHPWQESDSPPMDYDIITPEISSAIWIFGPPPKMIIIRVTQVKPEVRRPNKAASRIDRGCSTK